MLKFSILIVINYAMTIYFKHIIFFNQNKYDYQYKNKKKNGNQNPRFHST